MTGPVMKFQADAISCCLWESGICVGGQIQVVLKATIERRYKDSQGQWRSTNSYSRHDIPLVIHVLQEAMDYMLEGRDGRVQRLEDITVE